MYLWKCWREYRGFVLGLLFLLTAFAFLADYSQSRRLWWTEDYSRAASSALFHGMHKTNLGVFHDIQEMNLGLVVIGGLLGALFMSNAGGVATEFEHKTSELLFTRPRKRALLMWTNWWCGLFLLEAVLLVTVLTSSASLAILLHVWDGTWFALFQKLTVRLLLAILAMLPMNMMVYGIASCAGVLCRSVSKGLLAAVEVIAGYFGIYVLLQVHFRLDTPNWWFDRSYSIIGGDFSHLELALAWMIIALLFPFAAQKILERRDVV
jgi:ABC-type transport system involved in multi-copper enzyme maturation permease subunit